MQCPLCKGSGQINVGQRTQPAHGYGFEAQAATASIAQFLTQAKRAKKREPTFVRTEPARIAAVVPDVVVPLLNAGITAGTIGLTGYAISFALKLDAPKAIGLATGMLGWFVTWLWQMRESTELLWKTEEFFGVDIDGDSIVGQPPLRDSNTVVDVVERERGKIRRSDRFIVPIGQTTKERLAKALLMDGVPFTRRRLYKAGVIDQEDYTEFYNAMLSAGLAKKKGNGAELSRMGRSWLREFLPLEQHNWMGRRSPTLLGGVGR